MYAYQCDAHPSMRGQITVGGAAPAAARAPAVSAAPPALRAVQVSRLAVVRLSATAPGTLAVRILRGKRVARRVSLPISAGVNRVPLTVHGLKRGRYRVQLTAVTQAGQRSAPVVRTLVVSRAVLARKQSVAVAPAPAAVAAPAPRAVPRRPPTTAAASARARAAASAPEPAGGRRAPHPVWHPARPPMRLRLLALVTVVVLVAAYLVARGGDPEPALEPGAGRALRGDPLAWSRERSDDYARRAREGLSHVLYAKSPGGLLASAQRTESWRPLIEQVAAGAREDPDTLEAIVLLESAGRAEAQRVGLAGGRGRAHADPRRDRQQPARHARRRRAPAGA